MQKAEVSGKEVIEARLGSGRVAKMRHDGDGAKWCEVEGISRTGSDWGDGVCSRRCQREEQQYETAKTVCG